MLSDKTTSPPGWISSDEKRKEETVLENSDLGTSKEESSKSSNDASVLKGLALIPVMSSLTLILFLAMLDISIVGTAIPKITSEFHRLEDVGWYVGAYQLASATIQPVTGKLFAHLNTKWTFLFFFFVFEVGSAVCGASNSSIMMIIGRVIAGLGASGLANGAITIIAIAITPEKRPFYTSIAMGISMTGIILGPLLGGLLTEHATWRWCFYINLPVGGLASIALALIAVPEQQGKGPVNFRQLGHLIKLLDPIGFLIFAPTAIMLLLALQFGSGDYGWNSSEVIGLLCGSGGMFIVFCIWEYKKGDDAMIPWNIVRQQVVWASGLSYGLLMTGLVVVGIYTPLFLQSVIGLSPTMSAVYMLPAVFSQVLGIIVSGALVVRLGYYIPWAAGGAALAAVTIGLLSTWDAQSSKAQLLGYQALFFSRGLSIQMAIIAIQNSLPLSQIPVASALMIFSQNIFGAVFVVVANTLFQETLIQEIKDHVPTITPGEAITAGGSAEAIRGLAAARHTDVKGLLDAYTKGFSNVMYLLIATSLLGFCSAFGMGWIDLRKTKRKQNGTSNA